MYHAVNDKETIVWICFSLQSLIILLISFVLQDVPKCLKIITQISEMEINPDIIKKNPDIVQTIKRVSTSVFFFCMFVNYGYQILQWDTLNQYCLQLDHENLIVFTRWSQSTLFSGPLSKMWGVFFCLCCLLPQEMICKVNKNNSIRIMVSFISSKLKKVTLVCQINIFSLTSYSESDLYLSMAWLNNLL